VAPPKPPYEEAMEALAALEAKQYLRQGKIREQAFELSEILKRYIGRRYETNAAEFTTEEILDWIDGSPLAGELRSRMQWFFRTTDPVKFAKWVPDSGTVGRFMDEVKAFLNKTRPAAQEQPPQQGEAVPDALSKS
jgi:hypothetical protein